MCLGLGYYFNFYRGMPLVREGGVVIMTHPTPNEFHPVHHPSYIDFFEQVLADTTDPERDVEEVGEAVRRGRVVQAPVPHELRLPRRAPVLHVVLGQPRHAAHGEDDHRRRPPGDGAAGSASRRPRRSTTRSRSPPTSSAAARRSPTSTPRRSWSRTSRSDGPRRRSLEAVGASASWRASPTRRRRRRRRSIRKVRTAGFPYRAPTVPRGVKVPARALELGADYDTEWARTGPAQAARKAFAAGPLQLFVRGVASPTVYGVDRLADLQRLDDDAPPGDLRPQPPQPPRHAADVRGDPRAVAPPARRWRAAADYFFDTQAEGGRLGARRSNAIPIDRESTSRRASEDIRALDRRRVEPRDLPGGRPQPRRLGPGVQGRRRPTCRSAPAHRSCRCSSTAPARCFPQGRQQAQAGHHQGRVRRPARAERRRDHAPLQRPHRGRRHGAGRRSAHRLLDRPPARAAKGASPEPDRARTTKVGAASGPSGERRKLGTAGLRRRQNRSWPDLGVDPRQTRRRVLTEVLGAPQ